MNYLYKKYEMIEPKEQINLNQSSKNDALFSHSHEFIELVYIFSGKGIHNINNKSYFISAGDLLLIRADECHSIHPLSEGNPTLQWINCIFIPEFIDFDFNVFSSGSRFIGTFGYEVSSMFQSMLEEFQNKKSGYLDILKNYLFIILSKLLRVSHGNYDKENYANTKKQMIVKKTLDYIQLHYKEKISLAVIAPETSISTAYLSRIFREIVDTSITEYINNYRLEQSCKLLSNPVLTVSQIAVEAGFCDIKFYYGFFHKHMGLTPGEFRRKILLDTER